jgi:hypothetical protein
MLGDFFRANGLLEQRRQRTANLRLHPWGDRPSEFLVGVRRTSQMTSLANRALNSTRDQET